MEGRCVCDKRHGNVVNRKKTTAFLFKSCMRAIVVSVILTLSPLPKDRERRGSARVRRHTRDDVQCLGNRVGKSAMSLGERARVGGWVGCEGAEAEKEGL